MIGIIMKLISGFWALFLVLAAGSTLIYFDLSTNIAGGSLFPATDYLFATNCCDKTTSIAVVSRKLKENGNSSSRSKGDTSAGGVSLDDYHNPIDPAPISKYLKPGPIQHGTPLRPFIPKPPPPDDQP